MESSPTKDSKNHPQSSGSTYRQHFEVLKDPLLDRQIKELPLPPIKPIKDNVLFDQTTGKPDWRILRDFVFDEGELSK